MLDIVGCMASLAVHDGKFLVRSVEVQQSLVQRLVLLDMVGCLDALAVHDGKLLYY